LDPGNGDGLLVLRMLAAVAANESASKSRRVRRKMDQVAAEGRPHGGSRRPFGFEQDRITHRRDEAEVIRQLVDRYLAGESQRSLATWLNDNGIPTVFGKPWVTSTLRGLLRSGRIAGLREHRGEVLARMDDASVSGRRSPRRYVLSGLCRCGKCGNTLFASARPNQRRYVCSSGPDHGGCGRLTVVAPPLEELVCDAVLYRLDTPELAASLTGKAAEDDQAAALSDQLAADREQLDELAAMWADKTISSREWSEARRRIDDRVDTAQRRLARLTRTDALSGVVGTGGELRRRWAELNLTRQAAIVAAIVDHVVVAPGVSGARALDPDRVKIVWRL
jgi:hypothetical protein